MYKLLGGGGKERIPCYCTGNNIEQAVEFGFKKLKLAIPHGPADGENGLKKNEELVKRARQLLGPQGEVMLDCWMAFTEEYTEQLAARFGALPCLLDGRVPDARRLRGHGRMNAKIKSIRMATGEHEYTRYGFKLLGDYQAAAIWQPDMHWCGGLTELRWIDALARSKNIPVIPHGGWRGPAQAISSLPTTTPPGARCFSRSRGPKRFTNSSSKSNKFPEAPKHLHPPPDRPGFGFELKPLERCASLYGKRPADRVVEECGAERRLASLFAPRPGSNGRRAVWKVRDQA